MSPLSLSNLIRQVDLFSLRLFVSAIEEKQIGLAAAREHIAASTATKRIQTLEDAVGTPLLERGRGGVHPTAMGEIVERCARAVLSEVTDMHSALLDATTTIEHSLSVWAAHSVIVDVVAPAVRLFVAERPDVELSLREADNSEVVDAVIGTSADLGVFACVGAYPGHEELAVALLYDEPLIAVVPVDHAFAEIDSVGFGQLLDSGLIATGTLAPAFADGARSLGRDLVVSHVVRTGEVAVGMVQAGLGVTVVPRNLLTQANPSSVRTLGIDEDWAVRSVYLAVRKGREAGPLARAFMREVTERARR
ncbi:LysR family transcriptional regulator [Tsukamurella sp. NPDC003166]|uniref:LysR family transcriptional regulator n=1 Tax=Tsukamurella sp. NPDC003166 TaxID=3154444 RepID=UPI0033BA4C4C